MLRLSSQTQQSKVRAQLELLLRNAEPGERLPSEPALAKRFGVSRTTIREVMSQLEAEGFIQRRQGSGTYVSRQPLLEDESLLHFVDFPTLISKQGHTPAMRQLGFVQQRAGAFFSTRFHIGEEDRILTRRCLYTADEHFCVLAEDSFPLAFLSEGQCVQLLWSNNTDAQPEDYPFLESLLEDKQHPLLFLSSMCLDNHNEPFISSQIYSDTDYIKYQLNRRIV